MKKYFYTLLAAGMLFACSQEDVVDVIGGESQMKTFKVEIPAVESRTVGGITLGKGTQADALIYAMYEHGSDDVLISDVVYDGQGDENDGEFTVTVPMAKDLTYDLLFLAYNEEYSAFEIANEAKKTNLKELKFKANQTANIDAYDAFVGSLKNQGINDPNEVKLTRPFAQINAATSKADMDNAKTLELNVTQSQLVIKGVPASYNVLEGTASSNTIDVTYAASAILNCDTPAANDYVNEKIDVDGTSYYYLTLAYVLAGEVEKTSTHTATFEFQREGGQSVSTLNITHLPIQRNYRTNVIGDLLTKSEEYTISIDAKFGPNDDQAHNYPVQEFTATYEAVSDILKQNVEKTEALTYNVEASTAQGNVSITIPDGTDAASLTFNLNNLTDDATITITNGGNDNTSYGKTVVIAVPENVDKANLTINLPSAHVVIKQGQFEKVIGKTSNTTLEIPNGVIIQELDIQAGNAVIYYGAVTGTIKKHNAAEITWLVDTKEQLENIATAVNGGKSFAKEIIKLSADIDLNNEQWSSIGTSEKPFQGTFDGGNYTIKNLSIVETEAKEGKAYIGFFGYAKNATIKNVTFENVNLNIPCLDIDHSQGHIGAVAGSLEGTSTIENVTVKGDIKVYSTQEANGASRVAVVAGGNSYGKVTMKNVHVIANEGSYLIANNNTGALAGQLQGECYFEDCSSNIDVTVNKFFAGGIIGLSAEKSTFINCHTTGDIAVVAGREGRANDHYRVGGIAGGWADGPKNTCELINCSYTGKVSGKNTDGSVAEPLDYAGYVGRGYGLTDCAGSKVIIDEVEYIQAHNKTFGLYLVDNAYEVKNAAGLVALSGMTISEGQSVKLITDIDLENVEFNGLNAFNPENNNTFDGQGYTISNWTNESGASDMGFIKNWVGPIKNVNFENCHLKTSGRSAIVAAKVYGNIDNVNVNNCSIEDSYWACGAVAGLYNAGSITNCTVTNTSVKSNGGTGGIVGVINEEGGERAVKNCSVSNSTIHNTGIYGDAYSGGGLIGMFNALNEYNPTYVIENCTVSKNTLEGAHIFEKHPEVASVSIVAEPSAE